MKVLVRRDSSMSVPVDCGEGEAGEQKLRQLVQEHGSSVTNLDGSPIVLASAEVKEEEKSFSDMTKAELHEYLDAEGAEYTTSDDKDDLVRKARAAARKKAKGDK